MFKVWNTDIRTDTLRPKRFYRAGGDALPWRPLPCRSLFPLQIIFKIEEELRCAHLELITSLMKVIDQKIRLTVIND